MIKCLFCNHVFDTTVWQSPMYSRQFICPTGHFVRIDVKGEIESEFWDREHKFPGQQTHVELFDFKSSTWKMEKLAVDTWTFIRKFLNQQELKKTQTNDSRHTWLLCAIRIGIIKDVRILIGKYMNYKPFNFWKRDNKKSEK